MAEDSRGTVIHLVASNRPTWCHDAIRDSTLVAENASKTVRVVDEKGVQAICQRLEIINSSGRRAVLLLFIAHDYVDYGRPEMSDVTTPIVKTVRASAHPLYLENGERIVLTDRVCQITETNPAASGGAQTGLGVRYIGSLEPRNK